MKHLVVAVSPDSSLELLGQHADVILVDKQPAPALTTPYDTLYIRSHFGTPSMQPQQFRREIENLAAKAKRINPDIRFIDDTDTVDKILIAEDKWRQYTTYKDFMPLTQLLNDELGQHDLKHPIYKKRLSSRSTGVTWDRENVMGAPDDWIIQESITILEELRIYVIHGKVHPTGVVRQSMTSQQPTQGVRARDLEQDELDFSLAISKQARGMDLMGLDVARSINGDLYLLEVNRSPGFAVFATLTGDNLADLLYS